MPQELQSESLPPSPLEAAPLQALLTGEALLFLEITSYLTPRACHLSHEIHGDCGKGKSHWVGHGMTQETGKELVGGEAEPQDSA